MVVTHSYVSQATHAFLGMLPLFYTVSVGSNSMDPKLKLSLFICGIKFLLKRKFIFLYLNLNFNRSMHLSFISVFSVIYEYTLLTYCSLCFSQNLMFFSLSYCHFSLFASHQKLKPVPYPLKYWHRIFMYDTSVPRNKTFLTMCVQNADAQGGS